ncbi:MAG: hypothetical protein GXX03_01895 [Bacteroidales bacterium]|nr:hypothetical protein [Bacteroidales bacterium]
MGNSLLWILDKGQIVEKEETYFDSFLLSYCSQEFQRPTGVLHPYTLFLFFKHILNIFNHDV